MHKQACRPPRTLRSASCGRTAMLGCSSPPLWPCPSWKIRFVCKHGMRCAHLQASADMVALYDLLPGRARLVLEASGELRDVPADAVGKGDLIRVLPGDRLPVDGKVVSGRTTVDESALTGEPMPVTKAEGAEVTAGTVNVDGAMSALLRSPR